MSLCPHAIYAARSPGASSLAAREDALWRRQQELWDREAQRWEAERAAWGAREAALTEENAALRRQMMEVVTAMAAGAAGTRALPEPEVPEHLGQTGSYSEKATSTQPREDSPGRQGGEAAAPVQAHDAAQPSQSLASVPPPRVAPKRAVISGDAADDAMPAWNAQLLVRPRIL